MLCGIDWHYSRWYALYYEALNISAAGVCRRIDSQCLYYRSARRHFREIIILRAHYSSRCVFLFVIEICASACIFNV